MTEGSLFEEMRQSIIMGQKQKAVDLAKTAIETGISPLEAISQGFVKGIEEVGERFDQEEIYLPELVMAADAMIAAMNVLEKEMKKETERPRGHGRVVIGTVQGDIHDIGKNIVSTLLTVNAFEVVDLGNDVPTSFFLQKVEELKPDLLMMSALLTTTMPVQREIIEELKQIGLRDKVKVMVGGAAVSQEWADEIEADGYGKNAFDAVSFARELLG